MRPPAIVASGTARERLARLGLERREAEPAGAPDLFRRLEAAGALQELGDDAVFLAEELVRPARYLGDRQKQALGLLALAALVAARQGSTRIPLAGGSDSWMARFVRQVATAAGVELPVGALLREMRALAASPGFDPILGGPDERRPLVVEAGHVYLERLYRCEEALVSRLAARLPVGEADGEERDPAGARIAGALADVRARPERRGGGAVALSGEQDAAVRGALAGRLAAISGGPGTGKTAVVVTLVRVLARLGVAPQAIALAAPTGKAAQRLSESLRAGLAAIARPAEEDRALLADPPEPRTIHRLLGYLPGAGRFRHHERNPISAGAVIVDEASMVDLPLFERLSRAVPDRARLVPLGDADQLPSVEAGAVFRDLVDGLGPGSVHRLTRSYRMDPSDPEGRRLLEAAHAVRAGDPGPLLAGDFVVTDADPAAFACDFYRERIAAAPDFARLASRVYRREDGEIAAGDRDDLAALLAACARVRLLTVTRRLPAGSDDINRRLHDLVLAGASVSGRPDFYPGEPIVVRRNDYERGLFNGDSGVVVRVADGRGPEHHFRAVFPRAGGFALFPLEALRGGIELGFAVTVHRAQGSEHDEVALLLPPADLPLLTRELLYTAITRARRRVQIVGERSLVRAGVRRSIRRFSGVGERLAAAAKGQRQR
jgi:exodeoxyribonuclease V alpha subunit